MNLSDQDKIDLLSHCRVIAVIGLSPKENRPSHRVAKHLQEFSYTIVPVRPGVPIILGEPVYKSIADIPFDVDLVNVFRASEYVPKIVEECIQCGIKAIWLQEGVIHEESAKIAENAGITVIMDQCIYKEIVRLGISLVDTEQK